MATKTKPTESLRIRGFLVLLVLCGSVIIFISFLRRELTSVRYLGDAGVVSQRGPSDCGSAALKMIFDHFRIPADYAHLMQQLHITAEGTTMLNLMELAESRGLRSQGWRLSMADLCAVPLPAILFIRKNHFVVLDSYSAAGPILIRDPACGKLRLSHSKLESIWGGEVLLFQKPESGANHASYRFNQFSLSVSK